MRRALSSGAPGLTSVWWMLGRGPKRLGRLTEINRIKGPAHGWCLTRTDFLLSQRGCWMGEASQAARESSAPPHLGTAVPAWRLQRRACSPFASISLSGTRNRWRTPAAMESAADRDQLSSRGHILAPFILPALGVTEPLTAGLKSQRLPSPFIKLQRDRDNALAGAGTSPNHSARPSNPPRGLGGSLRSCRGRGRGTLVASPVGGAGSGVADSPRPTYPLAEAERGLLNGDFSVRTLCMIVTNAEHRLWAGYRHPKDD